MLSIKLVLFFKVNTGTCGAMKREYFPDTYEYTEIYNGNEILKR